MKVLLWIIVCVGICHLRVRIPSSFRQLRPDLASPSPNTILIRTAPSGCGISESEYHPHSDSSARIWHLRVRIPSSFGQLRQDVASPSPNASLIRTAPPGFGISESEYYSHSDSSARDWLLRVRIPASFGGVPLSQSVSSSLYLA